MNNRPSTVRVFGSSLVADPFTPQFRAYRYGGDQPYVPPKPVPAGFECLAYGCVKKRHSAEYCDRHYRNYKVYGTPYVPDRRRKENRNAGSSS